MGFMGGWGASMGFTGGWGEHGVHGRLGGRAWGSWEAGGEHGVHGRLEGRAWGSRVEVMSRLTRGTIQQTKEREGLPSPCDKKGMAEWPAAGSPSGALLASS